MTINDAQVQAAKISAQLGWKKFDTEKKLYRATATPRMISQAQEEFFILLSPDTTGATHNLYTRFGQIISERGSYFGFDVGKQLDDQNYYFAGSVTIAGLNEGVEVLFPLLKVYKLKD